MPFGLTVGAVVAVAGGACWVIKKREHQSRRLQAREEGERLNQEQDREAQRMAVLEEKAAVRLKEFLSTLAMGDDPKITLLRAFNKVEKYAWLPIGAQDLSEGSLPLIEGALALGKWFGVGSVTNSILCRIFPDERGEKRVYLKASVLLQKLEEEEAQRPETA